MSDHEVGPEPLAESTEIVSDLPQGPERPQIMLSASLPHFSPAQTHESPLIVIEAVLLNTTISSTETYTRPIYASPTAIAAGLLPGDNSDFGDILHTFKDALCTLQVVLRVMGRGTTGSLSFRESSLIGNSLHEYLIWESGFLEAHEAVLETAYVIELPPLTSPEDRSELTRRLQVLDQHQRLLFAKDWHENVGILNEDAIDWLRTCHHPFAARPTASPSESASTSRTASPANSNGPKSHHYNQRVEGDNFRSRSPSISGSFINLDPQSQSLSRSNSATTIRSPLLELGVQARAVDLLQQVGFWIYGTAVGQIMTNAPDPRENYKKLYSSSPIWLMGTQFRSEFWDSSVGWRRVVSLSPIQKLLYRAPPPDITTNQSSGKSYSVREWLRAESCEIGHLVPLLASLLDSSPLGPSDVRYKIGEDGWIVLEATKGCLHFSLRSRGALIDCKMVAPRGNALEARTLFCNILSSILALATQCAIKPHRVPKIERLLLHVYGSQITEGPYPQIPNSKATLPSGHNNLDDTSKEMNVLLWSAHINDWISRTITVDPSHYKLRINTLDPSSQDAELDLKECAIFAFDDDSRRFALTHKTFGCICFRTTSPNDFRTIVKLAAQQAVGSGDFSESGLPATTIAPQSPPVMRAKVAMSGSPQEMGGLDEFLAAFESCFWFTYRRDLPRLVPSILSSDAGFGCMLRAGQSMMAEALGVLLLGRHRNLDRVLSEPQALEQYKAIMSLFLDVEDQAAIFSVVHLIQLGVHMGIPIGQHFNASVLARALRQQCHRRPDIPCEIFFVKNGEIARNLLLEKVRHKAQVVLLTLRLGADCLNPQYTALIKTALSSPYSLGLIGGRAPRAFYIVGFQDDSLLYLDPHLLRGTCLDMNRIVTEREYHTRAVCELSLSHLDPTVLFGFLCQSEADVEGLVGSLLSSPVPMPLFNVVELRPQRDRSSRKDRAKSIWEFDNGGLDDAPRIGGGGE